MTETMLHAPPKTPATYPCADCGASVARNKSYCSVVCRTRFWNRMAKRGRVAMPIALGWAGRRGTIAPAKGAFAELTRYLDACNREDREAGRPPMYLVLQRNTGGLRWHER